MAHRTVHTGRTRERVRVGGVRDQMLRAAEQRQHEVDEQTEQDDPQEG